MKKMTKTTIGALAALVIWPIAMLLGYRSTMMHIAAVAALYLWGMQWINAVPMATTKKKVGFRNG